MIGASTASRRRRTLVLLPAVAVVLAGIAGCSGDDDNPPPTAAPTPARGEEVVGCRTDVAVAGDQEAAWSGRAQVNLRSDDDEGAGPGARYVSQTNAGNSLTLFSDGPDFEQTLTLTVGLETYQLGDDVSGVEIAADGSGAEIDTELSEGSGDTVQLEATFTCQEPERDDEE